MHTHTHLKTSLTIYFPFLQRSQKPVLITWNGIIATLGPNLEFNLTCKLFHKLAWLCRWGPPTQPPRQCYHNVAFQNKCSTHLGAQTRPTQPNQHNLTYTTWPRPLMEDDLWWKMTFVGRGPLIEEDLWWKTTFDGRQLWWKPTIDRRRPLMEDNFSCKMSFDEREALMEDELRLKMTLDGRQPLMENGLSDWDWY